MIHPTGNTNVNHEETTLKRNSKHVASQLAEAKDNPWGLFTCEELATMLRVSVDAIYAIKKDPHSRFPFNKSRPEWLIQFLEDPDNRKFGVK